MIQAILLILKIIGIILLVILGLLLLILAAVLFVPVFYKVKVIRTTEETKINAKVSYLFPLFLGTVQYLKKLTYRIRIFGFVVQDSERPKKEKHSKPKKEKKKKEKRKNPAETAPQQPQPVMVHQEKNQQPDPVYLIEEEEEQDTFLPLETKPQTTSAGQKQPQQKEKKNFFEKIKAKILKLWETIRNIINKIKKLLRQKDALQELLSKQENKQAIRFAWDKLKHLLKHILPRKMKGYLAFGTGDPASTGQLLGIIGVLYAKTGNFLDIRPNFMEKQLETDIEMKGRIQVFTLLLIALKVYFNQEIKNLIVEFKNIKEIE